MKKKKLKSVRLDVGISPNAMKLFKALRQYYTLNKPAKLIEMLITQDALSVGGILEPVELTDVQKVGLAVCQQFADEYTSELAAKRTAKNVCEIPRRKQGLYLGIITDAIEKGEKCSASQLKK